MFSSRAKELNIIVHPAGLIDENTVQLFVFNLQLVLHSIYYGIAEGREFDGPFAGLLTDVPSRETRKGVVS
jgi:hypothetical protein